MLDDNRLEAEDKYEKEMLKEWNFAVNTPMQAALNGFRNGWRGKDRASGEQNNTAVALLKEAKDYINECGLCNVQVKWECDLEVRIDAVIAQSLPQA
jgi:hypothetical protein